MGHAAEEFHPVSEQARNDEKGLDLVRIVHSILIGERYDSILWWAGRSDAFVLVALKF